MSRKVFSIIIFILIIAIITISVLLIILKNKYDDLDIELKKGEIEKLKTLELEKNNQIKLLIKNHDSITRILKEESDNIKYIPYEKALYIDRNVDAALDIIAGYEYDTRANKKEE